VLFELDSDTLATARCLRSIAFVASILRGGMPR